MNIFLLICMIKRVWGEMLQVLGAQVEMAVSVKSYFRGKIETREPLDVGNERKRSMNISSQFFSLGDRESHLHPCHRRDGKTGSHRSVREAQGPQGLVEFLVECPQNEKEKPPEG